MQHAIAAAARLDSFEDAAFAVDPSGQAISGRHIRNLVQEVGSDLAKARDEQADQRLHRRLEPSVEHTPDVVAVEVDGGRLRTRASDAGPGVHQAMNQEDKIACLVTLRSESLSDDPQPDLPESYLKPRRIERLVKQMAGQAGSSDSETSESAAEAEPAEGEPAVGREDEERWSPVRLLRTCVASMATSRSFGPMMAGEAQARDFYAAPRRAFVADGLAYNWSIQEGYFPHFEPIVDFLHAICYLYKAARGAGVDEASRWELYADWAKACWQGRVSSVVADLEGHQGRVGVPPPKEDLAATDPRRLLAEALSYLRNNSSRMAYPRYRREGLPTTSSLVESLVGEFNTRVKSKQQYWNRSEDKESVEGAEAILQIRAAFLSEDGRLNRYFAERPGNPYRRRYQNKHE